VYNRLEQEAEDFQDLVTLDQPQAQLQNQALTREQELSARIAELMDSKKTVSRRIAKREIKASN
jgi:hypothetical protein